jgi:hypothetical protein
LATIADHCRLENVEKKTAGATSFSLGDYAKNMQAYHFYFSPAGIRMPQEQPQVWQDLSGAAPNEMQ